MNDEQKEMARQIVEQHTLAESKREQARALSNEAQQAEQQKQAVIIALAPQIPLNQLINCGGFMLRKISNFDIEVMPYVNVEQPQPLNAD